MAMARDKTIAAVTASTTQTQAGGTVLNADINVLTVANASNACTLPADLPEGTEIVIYTGANAGLLFPPVGGAINGGSVNASKPLDANVIYYGFVITAGAASTYRFQKMAALSA